jgi:hypothetical protein
MPAALVYPSLKIASLELGGLGRHRYKRSTATSLRPVGLHHVRTGPRSRCVAASPRATPLRIDHEMDKPQSWNQLRDRRMKGPATRTGYEQAKAAYELGRLIRELRERHAS